MMAGFLLLFLGFTGLGSAVRFIPRPVVIGFTNGIALLIASTQIKDFLGLPMKENPSEFFARIRAIAASLGTIDWTSFALALSSLALILLVPKLVPRLRVPSPPSSPAPGPWPRLHFPWPPSAQSSAEFRKVCPHSRFPNSGLT